MTVHYRNLAAATIFLTTTILLAYHSHTTPLTFIAMFFTATCAGLKLYDSFCEVPVWDMEDHRFLNSLLSVKFLEHK